MGQSNNRQTPPKRHGFTPDAVSSGRTWPWESTPDADSWTPSGLQPITSLSQQPKGTLWPLRPTSETSTRYRSHASCRRQRCPLNGRSRRSAGVHRGNRRHRECLLGGRDAAGTRTVGLATARKTSPQAASPSSRVSRRWVPAVTSRVWPWNGYRSAISPAVCAASRTIVSAADSSSDLPASRPIRASSPRRHPACRSYRSHRIRPAASTDESDRESSNRSKLILLPSSVAFRSSKVIPQSTSPHRLPDPLIPGSLPARARHFAG